MARRKYEVPHGEGSFYQRADGKWRGVLEVGWTEAGTRKRKTFTGRDKNEVFDRMTAARRAMARGEMVATSAPTVKAWSDTWLDLARDHLTPSSIEQHASRIRRWIIPTLGRKRIDRLTPGDLRAVQDALAEAQRSLATRRAVHSTLMTLLNAAVAEGHDVPRPVLAVRKPPTGPSGRDAIPLEPALRLVEVASLQPDASRWVAALLQGMRQAECLGLTWDAVDLEREQIDVGWQLVSVAYSDRARRRHDLPEGWEHRHLEGTRFLARPKSLAGSRIVPLVPWMRDALAAWREIAPESPHGLVWPAPTGRPMGMDADRRRWYELTDAAEAWKSPGERDAGGGWAVEPVRYKLHEARHTAASLLLLAGVDVQVVQAVMGWSSVAMARVYQHSSPELAREALLASAKRLQLEP